MRSSISVATAFAMRAVSPSTLALLRGGAGSDARRCRPTPIEAAAPGFLPLSDSRSNSASNTGLLGAMQGAGPPSHRRETSLGENGFHTPDFHLARLDKTTALLRH